jgi:pimeloyl-ACP methyl ester carboxylesterase
VSLESPSIQCGHVTLADGTSLATRRRGHGGIRFLLVHGLASNAQMWDLVSAQLALAGHEVVAVDLRGHGQSSRPSAGYSTTAAAQDLNEVLSILNWGEDHPPVVAGQSWGANVVMKLAASNHQLKGVCCVDGGWIWLGAHYDTFDACWDALAPPDHADAQWPQVVARIETMVDDWPAGSAAAILANLEVTADGQVRNRLSREAHRQILYSLWSENPAEWLASISTPTRWLVAGESTGVRADAIRLAAAKCHAVVRWYPTAHHDLHLQHPHQVAQDLLAVAAENQESGEQP